MLSIINLGHQLQNSVVHLVNVVRLEYFHCIPDWDFVWDNTSSFTQCLSRQFGNSFVDASQPGSALESASYVKTQPHWDSVEQRLRSAANCFPVRVESVWREAVTGGLSFCKARRWIWLKLDCGVVFKTGCLALFLKLLIGQVGVLDRITSSFSSFNSKLPNPTHVFQKPIILILDIFLGTLFLGNCCARAAKEELRACFDFEAPPRFPLLCWQAEIGFVGVVDTPGRW